MLRPAAGSLIVCALVGVGCSTPAVDDVADASSAMTQGLVVVDRALAPDAAPEVSVSAKFMRLAPGVEPDAAERVVGARLELPAVGTCAPLAAADEIPQLSRGASIELLDVGEVRVRGGRAAPVSLATRAFPDVGDLVSGVFYTTRDDAGDRLGPGALTVLAAGSPQVEPFDVAADAPADLTDVLVDDAPLTDASVLPAGREATLRWTPGGGSNSEDRILVDVTNAAGATTRCAFTDGGSAAIPGDVFDERALGTLPAAASIEVHRIRRVFFGTSAIDAGEVRFDVSVLARATVGPAAD